MLKRIVLLCAALLCCSAARADQKLAGWCQQIGSSTRVQGCTISIFDSGTSNLSTIFADNVGTPKPNPFQADIITGYWSFYAPNARYDVRFSGGTPSISPAYTLSDYLLNDPGSTTSFGGEIIPTTPDTGNVGTVANPWGAARIDAITANSSLVSLGTLSIAGLSTLTGAVSTGGALTVGTTLNVTGASTLAALSATTGTFSSTFNATGAATFGNTLTVTGKQSLTVASDWTEVATPGSSPAAGHLFVYGKTGSESVCVKNSGGTETCYGAGTGITTLNGLNNATQTFAVGTAGTDFAIVSAGSTHTFNIPSATAANRGLLTAANWSTFNAKESALTFNAPLSRAVNAVNCPTCATASVLTANRIPKISASPALADSLLSDTGTVLTYTGTGGFVTPIDTLGQIIPGSLNTKTLTNTVVTNILDVAVGTNASATVILDFLVVARDATPHIQNLTGTVSLLALNNNGAITCTTDVHDEKNLVSAGTLTDAWTSAAGAGVCTFKEAATTSFGAPTSIVLTYHILNISGTAITRD